MNLSDIPGFTEEVSGGRFIRNAAFLDLRENICGVQVLPVSLLHLVTLETIGSPFIMGGPVTPVDVATFLWIVSPDYSPKARFKRWRFLHRVGKLKVAPPDPLPEDFSPALHTLRTLIAAIGDYLRESESDLPAAAGPSRPNHKSVATILIDLLASQYGWREQDILRMPLKRILAYRARIMERERAGSDNPGAEAKQRWLDARAGVRSERVMN